MTERDPKDLFFAALEIDERERPEWLSARCGGDSELREEVEGLLSGHQSSTSIFGREPSSNASHPGDVIGPFQLLDRIGEGGFAVVWRAKQSAPIERIVALKILKPGIDSAEVVRRFELERQALAVMDHPSIAKMFDGGTTDRSMPWFAMEFVDGEPLTTYCERRDLSRRERIELFQRVCAAVQHAHQKGVIHRDLKPSNVLVRDVDGHATPVVIDFGIAKALQPSDASQSLLTTDGQIIGTPAYMSPEQIRDGQDVDTRADVYALGAMLYEMFAGVRPFEDEALRAGGLAGVLRVIEEQAPVRPSQRLGSATTLTRREVKGDLDWVVMRCLEKDRERRYGSVTELANDLERHLSGVPVVAGPPDLAYRAKKFVLRHRWALAFAITILVSLVAGIIATTLQRNRAVAAEASLTKQYARAELELKRSKAGELFFEEVLMGIDPDFARGQDTQLLESILRQADERVGELSDDTPLVEAGLRRVIGGAYDAISRPKRALAQLERAYELRKSDPDADPLDRFESAHELAYALRRAGAPERALPLVEEAAEGYTSVLGAQSDEALSARATTAVLLRDLGRTSEAVGELEALEALHLTRYGELDERTLRVRNNLASTLEAEGRFDEALERYRDIAQVQEELQGVAAPETMMAWNNHGQLLLKLGRHAEARPILERAVARKREVYSPGHASLLVSEVNLAQTLHRLGETGEAVAQLARALEAAESHERGSSPTAIKARLSLGGLEHALGRPDAALATFRAAERALGEQDSSHPSLDLAVRTSLAWQLTRMEQHAEANPIHQAALELAEAVVPHDSKAFGVYQARLGISLARLGHTERATQLLESALELAKRHGDSDWIERATNELARLK